MIAVIQVGSSQYKITKGDTIEVDLQDEEVGKSFTLDKVLLLENGDEVRVGQPFLKEVKVKAKVIEHTKGKKQLVYKYRLRKDSKSLKGHRSKLTSLNIVDISV